MKTCCFVLNVGHANVSWKLGYMLCNNCMIHLVVNKSCFFFCVCVYCSFLKTHPHTDTQSHNLPNSYVQHWQRYLSLLLSLGEGEKVITILHISVCLLCVCVSIALVKYLMECTYFIETFRNLSLVIKLWLPQQTALKKKKKKRP